MWLKKFCLLHTAVHANIQSVVIGDILRMPKLGAMTGRKPNHHLHNIPKYLGNLLFQENIETRFYFL